MAQAPQWATRLVQRVADDYGAESPALTWRRSRGHFYSSGRYYEWEAARKEGATLTRTGRNGQVRTFEGWEKVEQPRIIVTAGHDRIDQKATVLHEMAHHLKVRLGRPGTSHGAEFYALLGELTLRYGGRLKDLRWREQRYAKNIQAGLRLMRQRRAAA